MRSFLQKFAQPRARGRTRSHQRRRRAARLHFSPTSPGEMLSAPLLAWLYTAFSFKTLQRLLCCGRINSFVTQHGDDSYATQLFSHSAVTSPAAAHCGRALCFRTWREGARPSEESSVRQARGGAPSPGDLCLSSWVPGRPWEVGP